MLEQLTPFGRAELERALRLHLKPFELPTREGWLRDLGALGRLVGGNDVGSDPTQATYEKERRDDEPSAEALVNRYGYWSIACIVARKAFLEGNKNAARPRLSRGRRRSPAFTREEARTALRACALDTGRRPSPRTYDQWARRERTLARAGAVSRRDGLPRKRIPYLDAIYRLYPSGKNRWRSAVAETAITDDELIDARRRRFGLVAPARADALDLPLSAAVAQAIAQRCSLEQLLDGSARYDAPPDPCTRFDGKAATAARRAAGVPEQFVREALRLGLGPYRRLLSGKDEPTLGQVAKLAGLLRVNATQLLTAD
jgi:hypothetical protein